MGGDGCGGGGSVDSATKAKVASILEGILKNLGNKRALVQGRKQVGKVNQSQRQRRAATSISAPVGHALQSLLARLQTTSGHAASALGALLASDHRDVACTYFETCSTGVEKEPIDAKTKAEVARILEGILKNLQGR